MPAVVVWEKIALDYTPPTIAVTNNPAKNNSGWNKSPVAATVTASDASGIEWLKYTVDQGAEQTVANGSATLDFAGDGVHTIAAWALDKEENTSTVQYSTVKIDTTKPSTALSLDSTGLAVTLDASDALSGVERTLYSIDGGPVTVYTGRFVLPTGKRLLAYWSEDKAGNAEDVRYHTSNVGGSSIKSLKLSRTWTIGGGAVTLTVALQSPALAETTVNLLSDDPAVSLPPSVTFTAGKSSKSVTVQTFPVAAYTATTITASTDAGSLSCQLDVVPPSPSLRIQPPVIYGTQTATGTVTLNGDAPAGGLTIALASDNPKATVPATVVVAAGTRSKSFTIQTGDVVAESYAYITASTDDVSAEALLTIRSRSGLGNLSMNPGSAYGKSVVTGNLVLPTPATANVTVALSANSNAVSFPKSTVVIAKGANSATFSINTHTVSADTEVTVKASAAIGDALAPLTVRAPRLSSVSVAPGSVLAGSAATGTVTLDSPSPDGGLVVALASNNAAATVPPTVTVPAGASTATFAVSTALVENTTHATIAAEAAGLRVTSPLAVVRLKVSAVVFKSATVTGGAAVSGTVFLTDVVPPGGATIALSSAPGVVLVPATVAVPAGRASATFNAPTQRVGTPTPATVTASVGGHSNTGTVTVLPPAVARVIVSPTTVVGGNSVTGTVTLAATSTVPVTVTLASSRSTIAAVPATVTVPAGSLSVNFPVTTTKPSASTTLTITAATGPLKKSVGLKVTP